MSHRFVRCPHCRMPHDAGETHCPATGLRLPDPAQGAISESNARIAPTKRADVDVRQSRMSELPPPERRPEPLSFDARARVEHAPPPRPAPAPPAASNPALQSRSIRRELVGHIVGDRYKVTGILGEGGMGTVYEAEHLGLGRHVAIKVLSPSQAKKRVAVKRFQQEARAAGAIGHPNICEVYDLGLLDDQSPYLVMEKLTGQTLADRITKEGGLPFDEVVDVMIHVMSGLIAAHEKGIVHRDIKPENIFLARRLGAPPIVKILDFGVSKMMPQFQGGEESLDLTRTGMVMGTPYYMSPEQARGERNLDGRVDVYACGVMMYESIAGRRPFLAPNYNALLLAIINTSPKRLRDVRPATPPELEALVGRAMTKNRDERTPSAAHVLHELNALGLSAPGGIPRMPPPSLAAPSRTHAAPPPPPPAHPSAPEPSKARGGFGPVPLPSAARRDTRPPPANAARSFGRSDRPDPYAPPNAPPVRPSTSPPPFAPPNVHGSQNAPLPSSRLAPPRPMDRPPAPAKSPSGAMNERSGSAPPPAKSPSTNAPTKLPSGNAPTAAEAGAMLRSGMSDPVETLNESPPRKPRSAYESEAVSVDVQFESTGMTPSFTDSPAYRAGGDERPLERREEEIPSYATAPGGPDQVYVDELPTEIFRPGKHPRPSPSGSIGASRTDPMGGRPPPAPRTMPLPKDSQRSNELPHLGPISATDDWEGETIVKRPGMDDELRPGQFLPRTRPASRERAESRSETKRDAMQNLPRELGSIGIEETIKLDSLDVELTPDSRANDRKRQR